MTGSRNNPQRREKNYRPLIAIGVIASILIAIVLALSGGSDDPVVEGLVPPVDTAQTGTTGTTELGDEPAYVGPPAVDGAPLPEETGPPPQTGTGFHDDHDHSHGNERPENEATDVGPFLDTASRFAMLNINRPTDPASAAALNRKLVELSIGTLAAELQGGTGQVATSQLPTEGEVFKAIPLTKEGTYAEVLIVTSERVVDPATGVTLDPKYLTYLVRLEKVPGGNFAVTSWEPQI